jgi:hypothetical protein
LAFGRPEHRACFADVAGERLFAQDVTATRYCDHRERTMRARRRCHADQLSASTGDRIVQVRKCPRHIVGIGSSFGALGVRAHKADHIEACGA